MRPTASNAAVTLSPVPRRSIPSLPASSEKAFGRKPRGGPVLVSRWIAVLHTDTRTSASTCATRSSSSQDIAISSVERSARTDALRGWPVMQPTSPTTSPGPSLAMIACGCRTFVGHDAEDAADDEIERVGRVAAAKQKIAARDRQPSRGAGKTFEHARIVHRRRRKSMQQRRDVIAKWIRPPHAR